MTSRSTSRSSNGCTVPATSWPVSWPLPATSRASPGRAALAAAVALARPGDTLLVAGKGHETGQEVAGTVHPFDDREVLREVISGDIAEVGTRA